MFPYLQNQRRRRGVDAFHDQNALVSVGNNLIEEICAQRHTATTDLDGVGFENTLVERRAVGVSFRRQVVSGLCSCQVGIDETQGAIGMAEPVLCSVTGR